MLWCTMQMSDGKNQPIIAVFRVDNSMRNSRQPASADVLRHRMPGFRVLLDQVEYPYRFEHEGIAQVRRQRFVPIDGFVQFGLGDGQKAYRHLALYLARTSDSGTA